MKRLLYVVVLVVLTFMASCKSHRQDVKISVTPDFDATEEWELTAVRGRAVTYAEGQQHATLRINPEAGTVSGHNGCNSFFGVFEDLHGGRMKLSELTATRMACPEQFHKIERQYMQLLGRCDGYDINNYSLDLLQGDKVVLTFDKRQTK